MKTLKNYFLKHSEQLFALVILVSIAAINYLIPYKLVFLNFFFIIMLLGPIFWRHTRQFWVVSLPSCSSSETL